MTPSLSSRFTDEIIAIATAPVRSADVMGLVRAAAAIPVSRKWMRITRRSSPGVSYPAVTVLADQADHQPVIGARTGAGLPLRL